MKPELPAKRKKKFSLNRHAEAMKELVRGTDKKILAVWATDCAERVLPYFEEKYPGDRELCIPHQGHGGYRGRRHANRAWCPQGHPCQAPQQGAPAAFFPPASSGKYPDNANGPDGHSARVKYGSDCHSVQTVDPSLRRNSSSRTMLQGTDPPFFHSSNLRARAYISTR